MPTYVIDVIAVLCASISAHIIQILTGTLAAVAVEPMIVVMAPGASALLKAFSATALREGDSHQAAGVAVLFELLARGSALGMGKFLADEFFQSVHKSIRRYRLKKLELKEHKRRKTLERLASDGDQANTFTSATTGDRFVRQASQADAFDCPMERATA